MNYAPTNTEGTMAKKSIVDQFRDFVKASSAESNVPMSKGEIAKARAKKKAKNAKKRSVKSAAKKKAMKSAKKTAKSPTRGRSAK
jgi:hypothetical protein